MKPGDLIEWTYETGEVVHRNESLWSTIQDRWVPISSTMCHLLVSIDEKTYSWLNDQGLFHVRVEDTVPGVHRLPEAEVVPRVRG